MSDFFNFCIFKLLQIYRPIMDNRTYKRNTFRPENILIASATLLMMMVSMGYKIPIVNQDQQCGISVSHVNSIIVDNDNVKWFSTDVGIVSYDGKSWKLFDGNEHIPNHQLKGVAFVENPDGPELWIASPVGATVVRFPIENQTEAITFNPENVDILSSDVACITSGNDSIRWIGTDKGVSAVINDKWLTPDYEMHYPSMLFSMFPITSMVTNLTGDSLYVGTAGAGVARVYRDDLDGISGASVIAQWGPIVLPSDYVHSVHITPDGARWFGTEEGIARHSGIDPLDNWTVFTTDDGLINDFVQVISDDKKGNIWIGTKAGISVLNDSSWSSYTTDNGLASNNILSIATDHDGVVWIGTDTGIISYENGKFNNY